MNSQKALAASVQGNPKDKWEPKAQEEVKVETKVEEVKPKVAENAKATPEIKK